VQDDYRIAPNFTLNVGLRYDIFGWFRERSDALANFDFDQMNPQVPYKGRYVYFATPSHPDRNVFPAHKNSIAPRINFAWTPFGDDKKTVIRGGYDVIYSNGISVAFGTQNGAISAPAFANFSAITIRIFDVFPPSNLARVRPILEFRRSIRLRKTTTSFWGWGRGEDS
jgi:hypothetical protein